MKPDIWPDTGYQKRPVKPCCQVYATVHVYTGQVRRGHVLIGSLEVKVIVVQVRSVHVPSSAPGRKELQPPLLPLLLPKVRLE